MGITAPSNTVMICIDIQGVETTAKESKNSCLRSRSDLIGRLLIGARYSTKSCVIVQGFMRGAMTRERELSSPDFFRMRVRVRAASICSSRRGTVIYTLQTSPLSRQTPARVDMVWIYLVFLCSGQTYIVMTWYTSRSFSPTHPCCVRGSFVCVGVIWKYASTRVYGVSETILQ
jgi:hypothetical protein